MSRGVDDVRGLWHRTIYRRGNDAPDVSTDVFWLQGPQFFADIRQPVELVSFAHVGCLRDLNTDHLAWLALQDAFAGRLELNGAEAWWRRAIDLQPEGPFADRARLKQTGDMIEEYGTEWPYYERWERQNRPTSRCWGLRLESLADGRGGFLVRAADKLMFGRARATSLPVGRTLTQVLEKVPSLEGKQDLLDFEVSLGSIAANGREWLIERSTLPFKQGRLWSIRRRADASGSRGHLIEVDDLDSSGKRVVTTWRIIEKDSPDAAMELDTQRHASVPESGTARPPAIL
jgi:hypothetical protein